MDKMGNKDDVLILMLVPYVDPVLTSQSYDISISIITLRRTNLSVLLVLMVMLILML